MHSNCAVLGMIISDWILEGPIELYSPLNLSFRFVLSCFLIRVSLLHTLSFTQYAIAASRNAVSIRPLQRIDSMAILCVRVA